MKFPSTCALPAGLAVPTALGAPWGWAAVSCRPGPCPEAERHPSLRASAWAPRGLLTLQIR